MRGRLTALGWIAAAVLLAGAGQGGAGSPAIEPAAEPPLRMHADATALERAVVDATLAFIRSDATAAREALDRVEAGCRRLGRDDIPRVTEDVVVWDQAFHKTVDLAREHAAAERIEKAFDQFVWVQKACRTCHTLARKESPGKPATPPPAGS